MRKALQSDGHVLCICCFVFVSYGFRRWQKREENGLNEKMFPFSELS
jgi:hypothetical protein